MPAAPEPAAPQQAPRLPPDRPRPPEPPSPPYFAGWLRPWLTSPDTSGVFVDFDGTLAPIVGRPEDARPLAQAAGLLGRLAARLARVAVISGRPVSFLAEHLGGAGATELVGLYGLERTTADGAARGVDPEVARWLAIVDAAADAAESVAPDGVQVERKGLVVTLHYRQAPAQASWVAEFIADTSAAFGLVGHAGKRSWELRPPIPTDKGTVVADLSAGLRAVGYIGDDTGDLPAFAALDRLRAQGVETLAVAVAGPETPDEVLKAVDLVVDGPLAAVALLEELAGGQAD